MEDESSLEISFIIPVFNGENSIEKSIGSILKWNREPKIEILVIDDGSTDGTLSLCKKIAKTDTRIKPFTIENSGQSIARNYGMKQCMGKYIYFVDADDQVDTEEIFHMWEIAEKEKADVVMGSYFRVNGVQSERIHLAGEGFISRSGNTTEQALYHKVKTESAFGYVWNKMFLGRVISEQAIRFCSDLTFKEDEVFSLQYCVYISRIQFSDKQGYYYNVPDWDNKYQDYNDFEVSFLIYEAYLSISQGNQDYLKEKFLRAVTGSLFKLYKNCQVHGDTELRRYKALCENQLLRLPTLSFLTKLIYLLPTVLCHKVLLLKGKQKR